MKTFPAAGRRRLLLGAAFALAVAPVGALARAPYPSRALTVMGGHVDMLFASMLETAGYVKSGKLRALAVTSAQRSPTLPRGADPGRGRLPNAESGSWVALLAPAGTPQPAIDRLSSAIRDIVALPEVREKLVAQGATPRASTPAELQKVIDADRDRYAAVIKARNLRVE